MLRREIQHQQSIVDAEQDKAEHLIQTIAPVLRDLSPLGNVHGSLMFGPLMFEIGVPGIIDLPLASHYILIRVI